MGKITPLRCGSDRIHIGKSTPDRLQFFTPVSAKQDKFKGKKKNAKGGNNQSGTLLLIIFAMEIDEGPRS